MSRADYRRAKARADARNEITPARGATGGLEKQPRLDRQNFSCDTFRPASIYDWKAVNGQSICPGGGLIFKPQLAWQIDAAIAFLHSR
jgi:hypothetical protein